MPQLPRVLETFERLYRQGIERHATLIRNEQDLEKWVALSRDWMTHYVNGITLDLSDEERTKLADGCVRSFDAIHAPLRERVMGIMGQPGKGQGC